MVVLLTFFFKLFFLVIKVFYTLTGERIHLCSGLELVVTEVGDAELRQNRFLPH